jgi:beta-glucosidase
VWQKTSWATRLTHPIKEYTEMGWEVYPEGLYELLTRVHHDYGPIPLYVTENGAAFADQLSTGGTVDDPRRISYLQGYLQSCWQAIEEGVPSKRLLRLDAV